MSSSCVPRYSEPAEATRPRIVSISGRPAATSEPKASTRMTSVTGQLNSSDFIIAVRLASLKSDHMPLAPVSDTCTPSPCRRCSCGLEVVGRAHHRVRVRAGARLHDRGVAVTRDRRPRLRGDDRRDARIGLQHALRRRDRPLERRVGDRLVPECTTTISALDDRPSKCSSIALARGDRLRAGGFPARARQRGLDLRGEEAEPDGDEQPRRSRRCGSGWRCSGPVGRPVRRSVIDGSSSLAG